MDNPLCSETVDQGEADDITRDAFLGGQLELMQPRIGYRAGVDAVLLAASIPFDSQARTTLLDCGSGVGTVGLCAAWRNKNCHAVLVEKEPDLTQLALNNIARNDLEDRVRVVALDICAPSTAVVNAELHENSFSFVVANPPFFRKSGGTSSPADLKAISHHMAEADFDKWLRFMTRMAKPGGRIVMIQHVEVLPRLLQAFDGRFGALQVVPIYPRRGMPANRVIVCAVKGSRGPFSMLPGFVLHGTDHAYSAPAEAALKTGAALDFF